MTFLICSDYKAYRIVYKPIVSVLQKRAPKKEYKLLYFYIQMAVFSRKIHLKQKELSFYRQFYMLYNLSRSKTSFNSSSLLNCSVNQNICVSPQTNELMCLPIEKVNDAIIDCLSAADKPTLCRNYL